MFFGADASASATDHATAYEDILTIARTADELGFHAVWTPERHFQEVGHVFPSPPVLSAALATATRRIAVRAGSVVTPLHHPLRIVEDWAVVDNLSHGRAGVSLATGWHSTDFVLAPRHYADRRERTTEAVGLLRRLWAGEAVEFTDGVGEKVAVRARPRPVSAALPLWLTSSGNPATWETAGRLRMGVLAATIGETPESLAHKIELYRTAYAASDQPGTPPRGTVTLMAHAYAGTDDTAARERVAAPLRAYLSSHVRQLAGSRSTEGAARAGLTAAEIDVMTEFAFERYLSWGSLVGSPDTCRNALSELAGLGCDEIACFVDFGLHREEILASLHALADLRKDITA